MVLGTQITVFTVFFKDVHYISEPFLLEQYVAIADYSKSQFTDISLREGNVVDVIEKHEHGKQNFHFPKHETTRKKIKLMAMQ